MKLQALLRTYRGLAFLIFLTVALCGADAMSARAAPKKTASQKPRVEDLLRAQFKRVPGNAYGKAVLDTGGPQSWYSAYASSSTVDFDGELYRIWFVGGSPTKDPDVPYGYSDRIGMATSRDGIHWEVANDGKPVLDLGPPGSPDSKGLSHPFVLRVGNQFMLWYGAIDGKQAKHLGLKPSHVRIERVCLATSSDGIHWQRASGGEPVMDIGPKDSIDSIQATGMHIIKQDDKFLMWYGAYNGQHTIGTASSPDGFHWTKTNDGKPVTGLLGPEQLGPSVYFDGSKYFMLYNKSYKSGWTTFAAASSDGFHWKPANDGKPVLSDPPAGNFDTAGRGSNYSVHPTKMLIQNRRVRVWYTGEDGSAPHYQRTGLMEAVLP